MKRLHLALLLSSSLGIATIACGGISDPNRNDGVGTVATVSGALTGASVPTNARVALVYRKPMAGGGSASVEIASDVPVVAGKFTMNLATPPGDYFADHLEGSPIGSPIADSSGGGRGVAVGGAGPLPADAGAPDPAPPSGGSGGGRAFTPAAGNVATRGVAGGIITGVLEAAFAGFVVYADTNGNGKLDLQGPTASTPDQILGGNRELLLVNFKGGGALDYEKLRDKSGILPSAGFNLAWTEGRRWLPLNVVELKLNANATLPSPVCSSGYAAGGSGGSPRVPEATADAGTATFPSPYADAGGDGGYPPLGAPGLYCSPDGRSFSYSPPSSCPPYEPPPPGLCSSYGYDALAPCATAGGYGGTLPSNGTMPDGWPCHVTGGSDGGSFDGGGSDSGFLDGGAFDGGRVDSGSGPDGG